MTRMCDGAAGIQPCPHSHNCTINCEFNDAELPEIHCSALQTQLIWVTWIFVSFVIAGFFLVTSYVLGKIL